MKYELHRPFKTRVLNFFRRIFKLPLLEAMLRQQTEHNPQHFFRKLIPPDYLYDKGSFRYISRDGIQYKLDLSNVVDHYLYFGIRDASFAHVLTELKKATVILDIGANIGTTSLYFASLNPSAKIIGFEPHPDNYARALENFRLNQFKNIQLKNIGLGSQKTELKLYEVNTHNPGMNRILAHATDLPYKLVKVEKLDTVVEQENLLQIDFIKLDVEGYEYEVLRGGQAAISRFKPVLFIELDDQNLKEQGSSAKELLQFLTSLGYRQMYRADAFSPVGINDSLLNCHFDVIVK